MSFKVLFFTYLYLKKINNEFTVKNIALVNEDASTIRLLENVLVYVVGDCVRDGVRFVTNIISSAHVAKHIKKKVDKSRLTHWT